MERSDSDLLDAERGESFPGRPITLMGRELAVVSDSRSSFELATGRCPVCLKFIRVSSSAADKSQPESGPGPVLRLSWKELA